MNISLNETNEGYVVEVKYFENNVQINRITQLIIGHEYIVVPPLYAKQKFLEGRKCVLEEYINGKSGWVEKLKVRYPDNNRVGRVSIENVMKY
jgi:hypothetical protein